MANASSDAVVIKRYRICFYYVQSAWRIVKHAGSGQSEASRAIGTARSGPCLSGFHLCLR